MANTSAVSTWASTCGQVRCSGSSANRGRARRRCAAAWLAALAGLGLRTDVVALYLGVPGARVDFLGLTRARRRRLAGSGGGLGHQPGRDGRRRGVSAGEKSGEPLMALGARHYGDLRATA